MAAADQRRRPAADPVALRRGRAVCGADPLARPGPGFDLLLAAAVRERCRPADLLDLWLGRHGAAAKDDTLEALSAATELQAEGVQARDSKGRDAIELPDSLRLDILRRAGLDKVSDAIAEAGGTATLTETLFAELLHGEVRDFSSADPGELVALKSALGWAAAAGASPAVSLDDV